MIKHQPKTEEPWWFHMWISRLWPIGKGSNYHCIVGIAIDRTPVEPANQDFDGWGTDRVDEF